jgi:hypothetical protein
MAAAIVAESMDTQIDKQTLPINLISLGCQYELRSAGDEDAGGNNLLKVWEKSKVGLNATGHPLCIKYFDVNAYAAPKSAMYSMHNKGGVQAGSFSDDEFLTVEGVKYRKNAILDIDGSKYTINTTMGVTSVFGRMFLIQAISGENKGKKFVLKLCKANHDIQKKGAVAEALIQHIIYKSTVGNDHFDCTYALKVEKMFTMQINDKHHTNADDPSFGKWTDCIGIIMELGDPWNCVDSYVNSLKIGVIRRGGFKRCFIKFNRMLQNLQRMYNFTHGDPHAQNLYYKEDVVKLIDFGQSSLTIDGLTLKGPIDPAGPSLPANTRWRAYDILYFLSYSISARLTGFNDSLIIRTIGSKIVNALQQINLKDERERVSGNHYHVMHWGVRKLLSNTVEAINHYYPIGGNNALNMAMFNNIKPTHVLDTENSPALPELPIVNTNKWCIAADIVVDAAVVAAVNRAVAALPAAMEVADQLVVVITSAQLAAANAADAARAEAAEAAARAEAARVEAERVALADGRAAAALAGELAAAADVRRAEAEAVRLEAAQEKAVKAAKAAKAAKDAKAAAAAAAVAEAATTIDMPLFGGLRNIKITVLAVAGVAIAFAAPLIWRRFMGDEVPGPGALVGGRRNITTKKKMKRVIRNGKLSAPIKVIQSGSNIRHFRSSTKYKRSAAYKKHARTNKNK